MASSTFSTSISWAPGYAIEVCACTGAELTAASYIFFNIYDLLFGQDFRISELESQSHMANNITGFSFDDNRLNRQGQGSLGSLGL